ncbi:hypothetical protein KR222_000068 [Zaprionus bogoriensis]|nr:hypothetical protein KR222_000068 [Zaprionus bogoriensis]
MSKRSTQAAADKNEFNLKLVADRSVVLVESRGFESEIFMPHVDQGRIILTNAISDRPRSFLPPEKCLHSDTSLNRARRATQRKLHPATSALTPSKASHTGIGRRNTAAAAATRLRFSMKLISRGHVLLVECNGYESEIFLPQISSRSVALKRVSANELIKYGSKLRKDQEKVLPKTGDTSLFLEDQAHMALPNRLLESVQPVAEKDRHSEKSSASLKSKRRLLKLHSNASGDA